jgi:hypothetical protein
MLAWNTRLHNTNRNHCLHYSSPRLGSSFDYSFSYSIEIGISSSVDYAMTILLSQRHLVLLQLNSKRTLVYDIGEHSRIHKPFVIM